MAAWSLSLTEITNSIKTLVKRLSGNLQITLIESQVINNAINEAMYELCMDVGVSYWRFQTVTRTASLTENTSYVDLTENVFNIIPGTVYIESEGHRLYPMHVGMLDQIDPENEETGLPCFYALTASDSADIMRLEFFPIPDDSYTLTYRGEILPDEDTVTDIPVWVRGALWDKAIGNALLKLGFYAPSKEHLVSYDLKMQQVRTKQKGSDEPQYITRAGGIAPARGIQSRAD